MKYNNMYGEYNLRHLSNNETRDKNNDNEI